MKEHEDYPWIGTCDTREDTEKAETFQPGKEKWDLNNLYKYLMETVKKVDILLGSETLWFCTVIHLLFQAQFW